MLQLTKAAYCNEFECPLNHIEEETSPCRMGVETNTWQEDFVIHPLDTAEQRRSYKGDVFNRKSMGRGEAAAVFETLAVNASQIERWLCIADAVDRLALNSPSDSYTDRVLEGFDELDITIERSVYVLTEVSSYGSWGSWPSNECCDPWENESCECSAPDHDQFLREVGAAIRTMINPAWSAELRARLVLFGLRNEVENARWLALR